jgi:hypothetical protein
MGNNIGAGKLLQAYHQMTPLAAEWILQAAQMYAEQYPRPMIAPERFQMEEGGGEGQNFDGVQMIGDVSPCGMSVIQWPSRRIAWSNGAYKQHFADLGMPGVTVGARLDDALPMFTDAGLATIFEQVAETGNPYHATGFRLPLPSGQITYWDWSLTTLPTAAGDSLCLLVQMHRVHGVALAAVS